MDEDGNKDNTKVIIPETVTIDGTTYTVKGVEIGGSDVYPTITTIKLSSKVDRFRLYDPLYTDKFTDKSGNEIKYYDHSKGVVNLPNLQYFVVDSKNTSLSEWQNKILLSKDGSKLICCPPAAKSGNVVFNGIKSFGPYAFFGCGLTKLVIPASLETIDETAFCGFSGLAEFLNADYYKPGSAATNKKFVAKDGLLFEMRQDDAGNYTKYKSLLCFPDNKDTGIKNTYSLDGGGSLLNIAPYAFDDVKTTTLNISNCDGAGISIDKYAFQNSFICFLNLPSVFVYRIGSYAFANTGLVKLDLGNHAYDGGKNCHIEGNAFYNSSIKQIVWPTNTPHNYMSISLDDYAMANCPSLIRVYFPKYTSNPGAVLTPLGKYAFYNCPSLEEVSFIGATPGAGNYGVLPEGLFKDCKGLKNVKFDDNKITEIGDFAFSNCNLQSWVFNNQSASLKTIGKYAFAPTINGTYNNFNNTFTLEGFSALTTIGDGAFMSCKISTSDINFYKATGGSTSVLKTIGAFAFNGNKFKTITIPEGVTEIGKFAFQGNNTLETINLPQTLEKFEWADVRSPFDFDAYGKGYETYQFSFGCRNLSRIVLRNGTNYEASKCGLLYDKRTMELIHCPENYKYTTTMGYQDMNVKGLVVENEVKGIKSLGPYCFDNSLMEIVVLPTTLQKIGAGAFRHAAVKSLTIPAKVTSVGSFLLGGGSTTAANIDLFMMPLKAPTITSVPNNAGEHTYLGISCNLYVKKTSFDNNYYGEEWTKDMKYYGYKIPIPITEKNRFFSICRDFDAEFGGTNLGAFIIKGYKGNPNSVIGTSLDCYVPSRIGTKQDKYVGAIVQLYKVKGDKNYVEDGNWYRIGERDFSYKTQEKKANILGSEGEENWLVGCPIPTYVSPTNSKGERKPMYALKYREDIGVSRFAIYVSNGVVPMNKAYLDLTNHPYGGSSAAKELSLVFEDESETTGIEDSPIVDVDAQQNADRAPYYTLNGTKVDRPTTKGIYIHNGKKIVIR
ncbi:MAG TPA: leucine-rich repeat domain-containing protein [Prevotella sp.]|nr:leucine-rich repeat domain-containing protein [Prevotella sp.]